MDILYENTIIGVVTSERLLPHDVKVDCMGDVIQYYILI